MVLDDGSSPQRVFPRRQLRFRRGSFFQVRNTFIRFAGRDRVSSERLSEDVVSAASLAMCSHSLRSHVHGDQFGIEAGAATAAVVGRRIPDVRSISI